LRSLFVSKNLLHNNDAAAAAADNNNNNNNNKPFIEHSVVLKNPEYDRRISTASRTIPEPVHQSRYEQ